MRSQLIVRLIEYRLTVAFLSVRLIRSIAADTVEERILDLQQRKAMLASAAFSEDAAHWPALDEEDIEFLFGSAPE